MAAAVRLQWPPLDLADSLQIGLASLSPLPYHRQVHLGNKRKHSHNKARRKHSRNKDTHSKDFHNKDSRSKDFHSKDFRNKGFRNKLLIKAIQAQASICSNNLFPWVRLWLLPMRWRPHSWVEAVCLLVGLRVPSLPRQEGLLVEGLPPLHPPPLERTYHPLVGSRRVWISSTDSPRTIVVSIII